MKQNESKPVNERNQRRAFFGQVIAAVGGGLLGGSLLKKILNSGPAKHEADTRIDVTVHPLAVPSTKEGSKSNV